MHRSNTTHSKAKSHHMTKSIYKVTSIWVLTFIDPVPDTHNHYDAAPIILLQYRNRFAKLLI